jgi:hypothetical protein
MLKLKTTQDVFLHLAGRLSRVEHDGSAASGGQARRRRQARSCEHMAARVECIMHR